MKTNQNYQAALDYIQNFIDYSKTHQENIAPENFELARMVRFLTALGEPHEAYPTVHVAGTKGKGSVSALCAGALQAAGHRVGLYTSPHLQSFTERIQINREPISETDFVALVESIKPVVEIIPNLTAYELQTALAFMHFANKNVDIAVIEVGMGGRLDSTNVIIPSVSVITSISLDHTFVLGNTLAEIAGEKGGIIKPGVSVVSAPQDAAAERRLLEIAEANKSDWVQVGRDVKVIHVKPAADCQKITLDYLGKRIRFELKLLGEHQAENAAVAFAALQQIDAGGFKVGIEAIKAGFSETQWPGRFEIVNQSPPVVLDGAHNRDSAGKLLKALQTYFPDRDYVLLFGASADKDIEGMFAELLPAVHTVTATTSSHPRAMSPADLSAKAQGYPCDQVEEADIPNALTKALTIATELDAVLVATGSLYALGEIREAWFSNSD